MSHNRSSVIFLMQRLCGPVQVAVLAMDVATSALAALQVTTQVREVRESAIEPHVARQAGEVAPLPPTTPQLLPQVHLVWGPLMAATKVLSIFSVCVCVHARTSRTCA